jgi:hypothetical protein
MKRNLDHVIVSVRDLDAAAAAYRRLGFLVMPRAVHHNLGTANHIIQLHGNYFELLGDFHNYADPAMREFMSARFEGNPGESSEGGLSMLSLSCTDLAADRERLIARGHTPSAIMNSAREVVLADGRLEATASSSMLNWRAAPRRWGTLFYSFHGKPQTIWFEPWMTHPNTVRTLLGITYCSDDFAADVSYINDMLCAEPAEHTAQRCLWPTPQGEWLELLSPAALAARFAVPVPVPATPFAVWPVALRYRVQSLVACRQALRDGGVPFVERNGLITVAAEHAAGAISEFTESIDAPSPPPGPQP